MSFDEDWIRDASHQEQSARERDLAAKQKRWAELDRRDLQGKGESVHRAKRERRRARWRRIWPWLVFFGMAAVLITTSRLLGW